MTLEDTPYIQRYSDGDTIISEGVISNNACVLLSGKVKITKKFEKKTVVISTLKKGDVFGEMGLIANSLRSANVSAVGEVTIGIIDKERFDALLEEVPEDLRLVFSALVERLRITTEKLSRIGVELESTRNIIHSISLKDG
jgi:CRP/FNR family transcriptional regulator, cyclic AMP receptor protein